MKLYTLSTGDNAYREDNTIILRFEEARKVLGTSVLNGGYREDLLAIFNNECNSSSSDCMLCAPTYEGHMRLVAQEAGLDPDKVSGMGTAAKMDNVAIKKESYEGLTVTAIVTGGVECNAGRVGDPANNFQPVEKSMLHKPGTINIMLILDSDMPPGTMARALVTCTEAKTAALQELMVGSRYSNGLATGTGTDQTIVIANPASSLYLESAGKHSKLGELIGCVVKQAVKDALLRQNGLCPQQQHSIIQRIRRFGITEESLWQEFKVENARQISKEEFRGYFLEIDNNSQLVTYTSLYVHLLDQLSWELLAEDVVRQAGQQLLSLAAQNFLVQAPIIAESKIDFFLQAWVKFLIRVVQKKIND